MPSIDHEQSPDVSLKHFFQEVPVLALIGSPHMVCSSEKYSIDDDVQMVCKYLRAYKIGGTKGIDRLYIEGCV